MTDTHYAVMADGSLGTSSIVNLTRSNAIGLMHVWRERMPETQRVYVLDVNTMQKVAEE